MEDSRTFVSDDIPEAVQIMAGIRQLVEKKESAIAKAA
jgi:hypothetical protein